MSTGQGQSQWVLRALAHPFVTLNAVILLLLSMFAGTAAYLDHRMAMRMGRQEFTRPADEPTGAVQANLPTEVAAGQTIYVPLYSHILVAEGRRLNLAATLSIRNVDATQSLTISSARYYDTEGNQIREYVKVPLELKPMGSTDFFVRQSDREGGAGANFVVEWVAEAAVHEPIVEAVMVGRDSSGYAAFTSRGQPISQVTTSLPSGEQR